MPEDLKAEIESKAPVSETEIQNMRNLNLNLNSAQFFYLAPKFPQHLKFDKNSQLLALLFSIVSWSAILALTSGRVLGHAFFIMFVRRGM